MDIPLLVETCIKAYYEYIREKARDVKVTVNFGDYANPSFESQVETIGKARSGQMMSVEAAVEELYGDDKDENWKKDEVGRIKTELGIAEMEEPAANEDLWMNAEEKDESIGGKKNISDEQKEI